MPPDESGKRLSGPQLYGVIDKICAPVSTIVTDDYPGYDILDKPVKPKVDFGLLDGLEPTEPVIRFGHHTVNHKRYEWTAGVTENGEVIYTNSMESRWAIVKRSQHGVYHSISNKYLPQYLAEYSIRQDTQKLPDPDVFDLLLKQSVLKS